MGFGPALRMDQDDAAAAAFGLLVDRAVEAYGIAAHFHDGDEGVEREALSSALMAVSAGFAAAAVHGV